MTDVPWRPGPATREPAAQPTAPYLEAVTAYGFRGSVRFHVPGHKGGEGADPGLRSALGDRALLLDVPLDIEGIDVGPSPTPYERAERLAAEAYGAERTWFLTNGATQGNHALCLALGHPGDAGDPPAQLAREPDRRPDPERRHGGLGRARVRRRARHGPWRHARGARARVRADCRTRRARSSSRRPTTACRPTSQDAPRSRTAHGAALVVDNAWGSHFGFHAGAARVAVRARRRRDAHLDPQDRGQPDPVGDAPRRADRADRHRRGGARGAPRPLHQPELAADGLARRGAAAARRPRRGAARSHHPRRRARTGGDRRDPGLASRRAPASSAAPASPRRIRCGS